MKIRSAFLTRIAAHVAVLLVRLLFRTVRKDLRPSVPGTNPYVVAGRERFLFCTWHDTILIAIFSGKPQHMAALVSRHQDGSYLAGAMELVGITPVRGSTNRGGATAMKQMMTQAEAKHITITPDGPRGPRRTMKPGIVFLASNSGRSIVPIACACDRAWRIRGNWTDLVIPKPFSTVVAMAGLPIHVPPKLSRQELDAYVDAVQRAMDQLYAEAEALAHRQITHSGELRPRAA